MVHTPTPSRTCGPTVLQAAMLPHARPLCLHSQPTLTPTVRTGSNAPLHRCLGPVEQRPSAQELLNDSFFLRRLGKGDSAKSMATMLPAVAPALTPRSSHRSETEGSDSAIHCQVTPHTANIVPTLIRGFASYFPTPGPLPPT